MPALNQRPSAGLDRTPDVLSEPRQRDQVTTSLGLGNQPIITLMQHAGVGLLLAK